MKKLLLFGVLLIFIEHSCISIPRKKVPSQEELHGEIVGNKYANPFFNLFIDLPVNWQIKPADNFKSSYGGTLLHADYFDSADINYETPLFQCDVKFTRINPFDRSATPLKELEETYDALAVIYDTTELIQHPIKMVTLAGKNYLHSSITIPEDFEYYMDEYIRKEGDYFVSVIFNYYSEEERELIQESLSSFKKLK